MGGREGLIDTAVKTADTGYMQRRLMKALEDLKVDYSSSVINGSREILQFLYGDDGIDPMAIDDNDKLINLERLMKVIKGIYPNKNNEPILSANEINNILQKEIENPSIEATSFINPKLIESLNKFFQSELDKIAQIESKASSPFYKKLFKILAFSHKQISEFFRILWHKYRKAIITPGEGVGAIAATSIGEPCTQMTLKTFHFAGVGSMNITQGVPRIKELVNLSSKISTPVIWGTLLQANDEYVARIVKGRIEKIKLLEVCKYVKEVISARGCYIKVKLDKQLIDELKVEIDIKEIAESIIKTKKKAKNIKITMKNIIFSETKKDQLKISPVDNTKENMYFNLQFIKNHLEDVYISGIDGVVRCVINKVNEENKPGKYMIAIEGHGLKEIMNTPGIDHKKCTSNDVKEVEKILGIEAARQTIINEMKYTFKNYGIVVDQRHLTVLTDLMSGGGVLSGYQRTGISKMKESVLMQASFERTHDVLFESAFHSRKDNLSGISEAIMTV